MKVYLSERIARCVLAAIATMAISCAVEAEVSSIKIGRSFSLGQLPAIIMEKNKLVEKHAEAAGIPDLKVEWGDVRRGGSGERRAVVRQRALHPQWRARAPYLCGTRPKGQVRGVAAADAESMSPQHP